MKNYRLQGFSGMIYKELIQIMNSRILFYTMTAVLLSALYYGVFSPYEIQVHMIRRVRPIVTGCVGLFLACQLVLLWNITLTIRESSQLNKTMILISGIKPHQYILQKTVIYGIITYSIAGILFPFLLYKYIGQEPALSPLLLHIFVIPIIVLPFFLFSLALSYLKNKYLRYILTPISCFFPLAFLEFCRFILAYRTYSPCLQRASINNPLVLFFHPQRISPVFWYAGLFILCIQFFLIACRAFPDKRSNYAGCQKIVNLIFLGGLYALTCSKDIMDFFLPSIMGPLCKYGFFLSFLSTYCVYYRKETRQGKTIFGRIFQSQPSGNLMNYLLHITVLLIACQHPVFCDRIIHFPPWPYLMMFPFYITVPLFFLRNSPSIRPYMLFIKGLLFLFVLAAESLIHLTTMPDPIRWTILTVFGFTGFSMMLLDAIGPQKIQQPPVFIKIKQILFTRVKT